MYFALTYDYVPDVLEKRTPFRAEHLANAKALHAAGKLVLAGAFDPPTDGALFVFKVDSAAEVEAFVRSDPYEERHRHGPPHPAVEPRRRRLTPASRAEGRPFRGSGAPDGETRARYPVRSL